jgi:hypothetical protein
MKQVFLPDVVKCHILQYDNRFRVHNGKISQKIPTNDRRYYILKNNIAYKYQGLQDIYSNKLTFVRFNYIKRDKYMSMAVTVYDDHIVTELYILHEKYGPPMEYHKTILH